MNVGAAIIMLIPTLGYTFCAGAFALLLLKVG
jgi:hypothetical protein